MQFARDVARSTDVQPSCGSRTANPKSRGKGANKRRSHGYTGSKGSLHRTRSLGTTARKVRKTVDLRAFKSTTDRSGARVDRRRPRPEEVGRSERFARRFRTDVVTTRFFHGPLCSGIGTVRVVYSLHGNETPNVCFEFFFPRANFLGKKRTRVQINILKPQSRQVIHTY